jgi:hypothetical protein
MARGVNVMARGVNVMARGDRAYVHLTSSGHVGVQGMSLQLVQGLAPIWVSATV